MLSWEALHEANKAWAKSIDMDGLADENLRLRPYRFEDAAAFAAAVTESAQELQTWGKWARPGHVLDEARTAVEVYVKGREMGTAFEFVVEHGTSGGFLGSCGINSIDVCDRRASLSYWVRTAAASRGVATAAAKIIARFGFQRCGLARIEITTPVANIASQRVAEKIGAKREGLLRNRFYLQGRQVDGIGYVLIPEDLALHAR